ncbi:hypothetical protein [Actinoplanes derwentensis]|uniref:Protocatechuate 3,4-dioxygenase beta subunit n=1 Tax=Actinoplanes derwentensis TaxID=113562 RepID=A0A1H1Q9E1_9ACTN|nr:hypothetical protein [Actinoplanes derwentensis]GID82198.1 hypothetical protein Ade03nite_11220 [Actinoplanes derwentensis]SDS20102.1 Protocatechuate 3,4-dioxygenase beta subunit [Actinoplanes derwentensis]
MRIEDSGGTPVISRPVPRPAHRGPQPAHLPPAPSGSAADLPLELVRRDIAGDRPGVPLMLRIRVLNAASYLPVTAAVVDLRHPAPTGPPTELRGAQVTDAEGYAEFRTVHPGRIDGAAVRIDASVHVGGILAGGRAVTYAGPLFVPEQIAAEIVPGPAGTPDPCPAAGGPLTVVPRDRFDLTAGLLATVTVTVGD